MYKRPGCVILAPSLVAVCLLLPVPPRILSGPDDFVVTVGDTINISCVIDGLPEPSITWATAEKTITPDDKYSIEVIDNTVTLVIKDATLVDDTTYTLTLENPAGTATYSVHVTVLGERNKLMECIGNHPQITLSYFKSSQHLIKPYFYFHITKGAMQKQRSCEDQIKPDMSTQELSGYINGNLAEIYRPPV